MREALHPGHEAVVDGLLRQRVEQVAHAGLVRRMDGPEGDLRAVVEHERGAHLRGGDDELVLDLGQFLAQVARLDGLVEELDAELRVRDRDQRERPLLDALAVQVGDAVLGDDVVHVAARRDDARAGREAGHDARDLVRRCAVDGSAMIGLPPGERAAPRLKSTWPPMPQ